MPDLEGFAFVRRGNTLVPRDERSSEMLSTIKDGREIMVGIRRARNPRFHRLFFVLLRKVVENDPQHRWMDEESLLEDLKIRVGHADTVVNRFTGEVRRRGRSINFASLDEDRFRRLFDRCVFILATEVLKMVPHELAEEVLSVVDGRMAA